MEAIKILIDKLGMGIFPVNLVNKTFYHPHHMYNPVVSSKIIIFIAIKSIKTVLNKHTKHTQKYAMQ